MAGSVRCRRSVAAQRPEADGERPFADARLATSCVAPTLGVNAMATVLIHDADGGTTIGATHDQTVNVQATDSGRSQPGSAGAHDRLGSVAGVDLGEDVGHMVGDGLGCEAEPVGDHRVR